MTSNLANILALLIALKVRPEVYVAASSECILEDIAVKKLKD